MKKMGQTNRREGSEMRFLGAKEAANEIRAQAMEDRSLRTSPEWAHQIKFAKEVTRELGLEDTPENVTHVIGLLREHDIGLRVGHEYPKWVKRGYDGFAMIADNEEHEKEIVEAKRPDPEEVVPATMAVPVQDLNLDLQHRVPQTVAPGGGAKTDPLPNRSLAEATTGAARVQGGFSFHDHVEHDADHENDDDADDHDHVEHDHDGGETILTDDSVLADNRPAHDQPAPQPQGIEAGEAARLERERIERQQDEQRKKAEEAGAQAKIDHDRAMEAKQAEEDDKPRVLQPHERVQPPLNRFNTDEDEAKND